MALVRFTENTLATRGQNRPSNQRSIVEFLGRNSRALAKPTTTTAIKVIQSGASGLKRLLNPSNVLAEPEEKKEKMSNSQNEEELQQQSSNQESTAAGGGGGGMASGGNSGGGIGGGVTTPQGVLTISNPFDFLSNNTIVYTQRFKFYLENANWITADYTDANGNIYRGRQFPSYDLMPHLLMWYMDYAQYIKLRNRYRYAKIEETAFEVTFDSHIQTFKTATTETQLAGNGNIAHILIHQDYHKRLPTTTFLNETPTGKTLGVLESAHYTLWNKLYGDSIKVADNPSIGAIDGPRKYSHRPTYLAYNKKEDETTKANPAVHIAGVNFYKARKSSFPVTAIGTSHTISFKPRTGMIGFGPTSVIGPHPRLSKGTGYGNANIMIHKDNKYMEVFNDTPTQGSKKQFAEYPSGTGSRGIINGVIANTSSVKPNMSTEYSSATIENMQMITAHQPWPTQTMPQLFIGVEPRLLPDGTFISGVSYIEINTAIVIKTEECHPLPIYPQHNADAEAIGSIDNFSFNDTGLPIRTGITRAANNAFGWHGAQLVEVYPLDNNPPTKD